MKVTREFHIESAGNPHNSAEKKYLRECVRILNLRVQVHPGELWVSKQRVQIELEASKSEGAKGYDRPKDLRVRADVLTHSLCRNEQIHR